MNRFIGLFLVCVTCITVYICFQTLFDILGRKIQAEPSLRSLIKDSLHRAVTKKTKVMACIGMFLWTLSHAYFIFSCVHSKGPAQNADVQILFVTAIWHWYGLLIITEVKAYFSQYGIFTQQQVSTAMSK